MCQNVAWRHSEPTCKKTRNLFLLHRGKDAFGANLALTVQGAPDSQAALVASHSPTVSSRTSTAPAQSPNWLYSISELFFQRNLRLDENMLGLRMLQKANFPTFMGNSLVMDTINHTLPRLQQQVCSKQPCGVVPHFNCSSAIPKWTLFNLWTVFSNKFAIGWEHVRTPDASEGKLSYLYGQ